MIPLFIPTKAGRTSHAVAGLLHETNQYLGGLIPPRLISGSTIQSKERTSIHARWFQRDILDFPLGGGLQHCFANDAIPPHQHACYGEDRGCKSDNDPDNFER